MPSVQPRHVFYEIQNPSKLTMRINQLIRGERRRCADGYIPTSKQTQHRRHILIQFYFILFLSQHFRHSLSNPENFAPCELLESSPRPQSISEHLKMSFLIKYQKTMDGHAAHILEAQQKSKTYFTNECLVSGHETKSTH